MSDTESVDYEVLKRDIRCITKVLAPRAFLSDWRVAFQKKQKRKRDSVQQMIDAGTRDPGVCRKKQRRHEKIDASASNPCIQCRCYDLSRCYCPDLRLPEPKRYPIDLKFMDELKKEGKCQDTGVSFAEGFNPSAQLDSPTDIDIC